ncbi:MAG TPA: glucose-6-phosphate dehydrogenase [Geminicoccus sp.]|uniref:glucose-6-phosphate dehydrogenase n=1 Tax=Geminicoccus sp. TaxID=2024832 RepID=UPI002E32B7CE|nr:glucose-6-phosphate dehydrogenase [Geminicoccus sp.]HEX2528615.1 glucose-6-phosphate dehydrogenase [Geminicoccus sp.]
MTAQIIPVQNFDIVVFGGTGDLALRKLLPGLYQRFRDRQMPEAARVCAVSRREVSSDDYRSSVRQALTEHVNADDLVPDEVEKFLRLLTYVSLDANGSKGWPDLSEWLASGVDKIRVFYLATAPELFGPVCARIGSEGLVTEQTRVVIEKPIGKDLASARAVNDAVGAVFAERQIFRIDHYLGKETVQNLMALRFANALFEPIWNRAAIDHVQITVSETVGVGNRADYYDHSGALRDMVQNHMLQLLCLVAMEPPSAMDANSVRDEKLKVLSALKPIRPGRVEQATVRGQYAAGAIGGKAVPGYLEELGRDSSTETFLAIKAEIDTWRWSGVPFYLRTGKRLSQRASEIVVQMRPIPHSIFPRDAGEVRPNRLVIRLQPDEGVRLYLMSKDPGPGGMRLKTTPLNLSFGETFKVRYPDAYERLLMDVVRGNQTLFMRKDEVEAAWTWCEPILAGWQESDEGPEAYGAGSWGPTGGIALMVRDGRRWVEPGT